MEPVGDAGNQRPETGSTTLLPDQIGGVIAGTGNASTMQKPDMRSPRTGIGYRAMQSDAGGIIWRVGLSRDDDRTNGR